MSINTLLHFINAGNLTLAQLELSRLKPRTHVPCVTTTHDIPLVNTSADKPRYPRLTKKQIHKDMFKYRENKQKVIT